MTFFVSFLFFVLVSSAVTALDFTKRLVLAAIVPSLYKQGVACGECYEVRCKNKTLCTATGAKVVVTDQNNYNEYDLVLSRNAYAAMALSGKEQELINGRTIDVEYKRVPCNYVNKNLKVQVVEWSQKPHYLAIKFLYQGGQTEIKAAKIAQVGSSEWVDLKRNYTVIWDASNVPEGALQLRIGVVSGYEDVNWIWAKNEIPAEWSNGETYDTGIKINDVAKEVCPPDQCGDETWK